MRWRKSQIDGSEYELRRYHSGPSKAARVHDTNALATERRSLASVYIMCRALIAATQSISKDSLSEVLGNGLEELTFDQFKRADVKMLTQSVNHRANSELYAMLLGNLANVRFESVTDRFIVELGPVAAGLVPKDSDLKYENLVKGLKHVQIKVWPPESFEEGAEFMESLSKSFDNAHGIRLKTIFGETLIQMLHSIGKTAQAEVNHPQWAKAIEMVFPKAKDMATKPRYWQVAFPLAVVSLCVAPREYFLRHWSGAVEAALSKLKDKPYRIPILNGIIRLVWTYLYRCHESTSTVTSKMEALMKHFFPQNRATVVFLEDKIEPFVYLVHYILSRHFDYGSELCMELLQERSLLSGATSASLATDRVSVAVQAILLSLNLTEREEPAPSWPSSSDFSMVPTSEDYPLSSDIIPPSLLKGGWTDFVERASACIQTISRSCYDKVGQMSVLDEQWSALRLNPTFEEAHNYIVRQHPDGGSTAYPNNLFPLMNALQTCYQAWPRLLHPSQPLEDVFDMLLRGVIHIEPAIVQVAAAALQRFMTDFPKACILLSRFCLLLFEPRSILGEGSSLRLAVESSRLLNLWISLVERWSQDILGRQRQSLSEQERTSIASCLDQVEAGALFLLAHSRPRVYMAGAKTVRLVGELNVHLYPEPVSPVDDFGSTKTTVGTLLGHLPPDLFSGGSEDILEPEELSRLEEWNESKHKGTALLIAESDIALDRSLWRHIFPAILQMTLDREPVVLPMLREKLVAVNSRYHQFILQISGVTNRSAPSLPPRSGSIPEKDSSRLVTENRGLIQQWHLWVKLLCATAKVSEARAVMGSPLRDHSRARSEVNAERDQMSTSRDMFRYLSQFLDSEHAIFRDAAVSCISSFPPHAYSYLLEDLGVIASRQIYDDSRTKTTPAPMASRARRQENLQTSIARIYFLTAHFLQQQRSSGKQVALSNVLKYVRNTQAFLSSPENRDSFSLQGLRRYFCGTVERLFEGLATLNDSDRFIPSGIHNLLYRMCEEWCQLGKQSDLVKKRLVVMQTVAAKTYQDPVSQAECIQRFQTETRALSNAAVGAMASLIQKAYFPPDITASGSPTDKVNLDQVKPLDSSQVLDRLVAILASFTETVQKCGKKALRSLLTHRRYNAILADEVLRRAFVTVRDMGTSNARFFEVVAEAICSMEHGFTFSQIVCLGLSNLCHPVLEIRRRAFNMLDILHERTSGMISFTQYEAAVGSSAPSTYLHAHRLISDILSGEHAEEAVPVLSQFASWIPRVYNGRNDSGPLVLLQSLEAWVPNINLMYSDRHELTQEGCSAIYHLMALTSRYSESFAEQILTLWNCLLAEPANGQAVIRFLLEQSQKVGSAAFISCAAKVVACLSHDQGEHKVGRQIITELCSIIEPDRMVPALEHKLGMPPQEDLEMWSDLDVLFSEQPRLSLGQAQFALLFLSDSALSSCCEMPDQLPLLLHALFMHLDHRHPFVQKQCRHMLFQLLRFSISGYDKLPDRHLYPHRSELKTTITALEDSVTSKLWTEDDTGAKVEPKMTWFCEQILGLLEPLQPDLAHRWGALALVWATSCTVRPVAFRSVQLFRALLPEITPNELRQLLGRLSNTIAEEDLSLQSFNVEIIVSLKALTCSPSLNEALLPEMYWAAVASLLTTAEDEFKSVLELLDAVLTRLNLDDPETEDLLLAHQPPNWQGATSIQPALLMGLRSSQTSGLALKLLQRLAKISDARLIDPSESGRIRDLYTLSLPWCLHAMSTGTSDETLQEFAMNIGHLADNEERPSITRIMTSFAKSRFRTKEDFLRQSVSSLREHYGKEYWAEVVTLLVGLVLNNEHWLRVHTLQILKLLFQQRETKNSMNTLGSELLMPLLRLLETELATEALDVLDEPMRISGGPSAKHILRMSLHHHLGTNAKEVESVAEVFGIAQKSGWCVPCASQRREICRTNLAAVFDVIEGNSRPSRIDFQPEERHIFTEDTLEIEDDLGDMVQNLHELSSFFQEESPVVAVPTRQLEARVAAILAKSTDPTNEAPQTPFIDIFDVRTVGSYDTSDDSMSSDEGSDLFEFDSPAVTRYLAR